MNRVKLIVIFACTLPFAPVVAEDGTLLAVMRDLGRQNSELAKAILVEDWQTMSAAANMIAEHPKPGMSERMKILAALGDRAGEFRGFDTTVHDAAIALREAAERKDIAAVSNSYTEMFSACVACHGEFRSELRALRSTGSDRDTDVTRSGQ